MWAIVFREISRIFKLQLCFWPSTCSFGKGRNGKKALKFQPSNVKWRMDTRASQQSWSLQHKHLIMLPPENLMNYCKRIFFFWRYNSARMREKTEENSNIILKERKYMEKAAKGKTKSQTHLPCRIPQKICELATRDTPLKVRVKWETKIKLVQILHS